MTSVRLRETLEALVAATLEVVEQGRNNHSLAPTEQVYFSWQLDGDLKYSEIGVEWPSARGETSVRPS
jgi:hypothetical protein